ALFHGGGPKHRFLIEPQVAPREDGGSVPTADLMVSGERQFDERARRPQRQRRPARGMREASRAADREADGRSWGGRPYEQLDGAGTDDRLVLADGRSAVQEERGVPCPELPRPRRPRAREDRGVLEHERDEQE